MAGDPNVIDQAISRALRENLHRIQRDSEDLHHIINDVVSACASSRPTNAWPAMVRAQVSAASLSAALDVLTRFIAATLQTAGQSQVVRDMPVLVAVPQPAETGKTSEPLPPAPMGEEREAAKPVMPPAVNDVAAAGREAPEPIREVPRVEAVAPQAVAPEVLTPEPANPEIFVPQPLTPQPTAVDLPLEEPATPVMDVPQENAEELPPASGNAQEAPFDVSSLPVDLQDLHRRAYRVAKVTMQDIKMIHPEQVRLGRENKDLCVRLRDDIEKAHREYIRRFDTILSHPVDYFYDWMVQILAEGDPTALGEYPYPSTVLHR